VLAAGTKIGPYEVLDVAGAGGMGEVYRARDTRLGRVVALKVLPTDVSADPDRRKRLEQEARVISSLSQPNICTLFDIGHQDGLDYLVMEFLEGETLQHRLLAGPLPPDQVLRFGSQIANALDKAHRAGVVHRDLKPGNIMLTKEGAKLLDFGLARFVRSPIISRGAAGDRETETVRLTSEGTILGTWHYMAPEQIEGLDADSRTDIFALGAVLYEMATGRQAFTGKSKASLIAAIMASTPPRVSADRGASPTLGPAFDRLVQRCLQKEPDERWQSARDLASELDWIASGESTPAAPAGDRPRQLPLTVAWSVAGLAVLAALFLAYRAAQTKDAPAAPLARLSLLPPPQTHFSYVAISPDGRRLAFTVGGPADQRGLWIRSLDSAAAQLVPGTAGAIAPVWSPDSRYVAVVDDDKLKRVAAAGGAPEILCQVASDPGEQMGAWSREGVVLRSSMNYKPITQISLGDCSTKAATTLDKSLTEIGQTDPVFLPDGRHFIWVSDRLQPEKGLDLWVSAIGSAERTRLVHNASMPSYVAPGYLVFAREGKLLAQAFDAAALRLSGDPFPIVSERVQSNHLSGGSIYSIAAGTLAYVPDSPVVFQLQWRDRRGTPLGVAGDPGLNRLIQLSPDGHTILAARLSPDDGKENLWTFDDIRKQWSRFTPERVNFAEARWSPDGKQILFMSRRDGQFVIGERPFDGPGTEVALLRTPLWRAPRSLSPDGRFLLFEDFTAETGFDFWLLDRASGQPAAPFVRTRFNEGNAAFSPDGRWVAYMSNKSGRYEIYVVPFPNGDREWKVSSGVGGRVSGGSHLGMTWRADGKEIFYTGDDWTEMAVPVVASGGAFQAATPVKLFSVAPDSQVDVSGDGMKFLVNAPVESSAGVPLTVVVNWSIQTP
jgi:serine/threonine protein kinase/Tol biopolymer transport system component